MVRSYSTVNAAVDKSRIIRAATSPFQPLQRTGHPVPEYVFTTPAQFNFGSIREKIGITDNARNNSV